jgi:hypothetical protein
MFLEEPSATSGNFMFLLFLVLILCWVISSFSKKTLVLKQFLLEPDNTEGNIVTIVARKSGLFAWILTHLFKISPETSLSATAIDVCFRYKSISTEENALITLKKGISHIYCKYQKPFWLLVLSVVVLLAGIIGAIVQSQSYYGSDAAIPIFITSIIIFIILFLIYHFKKSITIVIETNGSTKYGIKFKPSFIEGQDVNLEKAREVVKVIQNQIIKEQN